MSRLFCALSVLVTCRSLPHDAASCDEKSEEMPPSFLQGQLAVEALRSHALSAQEAEASSGNFCEAGKLLPKFWLIGSQKAATTSMATDLIHAGIGAACGVKECHYFEEEIPVPHVYPRRGIKSIRDKQKWLDSLPDCPTNGTRVVGDFTPSGLSNEDVPRLLAELLGDKKREITVALTLREPVARCESQWHEGTQNRLKSATCPGCFGKSFDEDIRTDLGMHEANLGLSLMIDNSLYVKGLKSWLAAGFAPKQFVVVPFKVYISGGAGTVCHAIARRVNASLNCPTAASHRNTADNRHVGVRDPQLRDELNKLFELYNNELYEVLARAHAQGMTLMNFSGAAGNASDVQTWLEGTW
eukprot:TRINITY_DN4518_c0_g1_i1.p1 TRINITY_DN4518_c0_g1~~TRINITY_DN4518_c0_g1_i1.p1  ORF type:complete len:357 (-),score=54.03 TRINITY_DN4518_c0_g1_i1:51-1121(-)